MRNILRELAKRIKEFEPFKKRFVSFVRRAAIATKKFMIDFKEFFIAAGILLLVGGVTGGILFLIASSPKGEELIEEISQATIVRDPLTGNPISTVLETPTRALGVMIENSSDAWPLSGLDKAFLVIEAPVEADIPRFLAFFADNASVSKIGPVRSARPYYVDWAMELDAIYAHSGGSQEALDLIATSDVHDLNEFSQGEYFYRANSGRYAPHNLYTTSDSLNESVSELEPGVADYETWNFKQDGTPAENPISLSVNFGSGSLYDVLWNYRQETNTYERYQGGFPMKMQDGAGIFANNVIVMVMDVRTIDSIGRKHITTIGTGDAFLAQDGTRTLITWEKDSETSRTRFYNLNGSEIAFNAGVTWIEVVANIDQVTAQ
ncbi:MAG: DUF3048 domain-containing protein [Patescibacteria group bacterium]|jgi:hypothetical protein